MNKITEAFYESISLLVDIKDEQEFLLIDSRPFFTLLR